MSTVVSCRLPDDVVARIDAQLAKAGLKNRSQAAGLALLTWLKDREGGQSAEDRLVARLELVIRKELTQVHVSGAGSQVADDPPKQNAKMAAFLDAGRR